MSDSTDKFCSECGRRLIPLHGIHISRECGTCGKTVYLAEPGEGGKGIKIEKGDKIHNLLSLIDNLSLKPTRDTFLYKGGVSWLIKRRIFEHKPLGSAQIEQTLMAYEKQSEQILRSSQLLAGLDLSSEADEQIAWDRVSKSQDSIEWWAYALHMFASAAREAIAGNDVKEACRRVYEVVNAHAMLIFKQEIEDLAWEGYRRTRKLQGLDNTASPERDRSVEPARLTEVQARFASLDNATLHTLAGSGVVVGSIMGIKEVPEEQLKASVNAILKTRELGWEKQRHQDTIFLEERRYQRTTKTAIWTSIIAAASLVLAAVVSGIFLVRLDQDSTDMPQAIHQDDETTPEMPTQDRASDRPRAQLNKDSASPTKPLPK